MNNKMISHALVFTLFAVVLTSCSTTSPEEDPLKYTRKLTREGHASLYNNGAFQVPYTEIKLIPAGESAQDIAFEMMGMQARQSFLKSVKNAADAVYIVPEGSKLSLEYAKSIRSGGEQVGDSVTDVTRPVGMLIVDRSLDVGKDITLNAWDLGKKTADEIEYYGITIEKGGVSGGGHIADYMTDTGTQLIGESWDIAKNISKKSNTGAKKSLLYASDEFIKGYVAVPEKMSQRGSDIAEAAELSNFTEGMVDANTTREEYSKVMTDLVVDATGSYVDDVKESFNKAGEAFSESVGVTGFGLAILKSSRWVLQGVLWDGLVKPVTKIGAGSVGYIAVNLAAFPAMVVVQEGIAVTNLAIEVTWNTVGATYDLVAPSAKAAVASIYSLFQFTAGNVV
ncbi:MAG: hypothetical protein OEY66_10620, partial [Gammaproteobacteria bacterium]|nr:hypothetical protein [Gammaproteobacteria bacterium]